VILLRNEQINKHANLITCNYLTNADENVSPLADITKSDLAYR